MSVESEGGSKKSERKPAETIAQKDARLHITEFDPTAEKTRVVSVVRSPNSENPQGRIDHGWMVVGQGHATEGPDGSPGAAVYKLQKISGETKYLPVAAVEALQQELAEQRERDSVAQNDVVDELGDEALGASGLQDPAEAARNIITGIPGRLKDRPATSPLEARAPVAPEAPKLTPDQYIAKLTEGFSRDDLRELRSYAEAEAAKAAAQKAGSGQESTYWGQIMGQSLMAMSPTAKAIASRYAQVVNVGQR